MRLGVNALAFECGGVYLCCKSMSSPASVGYRRRCSTRRRGQVPHANTPPAQSILTPDPCRCIDLKPPNPADYHDANSCSYNTQVTEPRSTFARVDSKRAKPQWFETSANHNSRLNGSHRQLLDRPINVHTHTKLPTALRNSYDQDPDSDRQTEEQSEYRHIDRPSCSFFHDLKPLPAIQPVSNHLRILRDSPSIVDLLKRFPRNAATHVC